MGNAWRAATAVGLGWSGYRFLRATDISGQALVEARVRVYLTSLRQRSVPKKGVNAADH